MWWVWSHSCAIAKIAAHLCALNRSLRLRCALFALADRLASSMAVCSAWACRERANKEGAGAMEPRSTSREYVRTWVIHSRRFHCKLCSEDRAIHRLKRQRASEKARYPLEPRRKMRPFSLLTDRCQAFSFYYSTFSTITLSITVTHTRLRYQVGRCLPR